MLRIAPLTSVRIARAAVRYAAYGVAVVAMSTGAVWGIAQVGGALLRMTDAAIIDGSGKADPAAAHVSASDDGSSAVASPPDVAALVPTVEPKSPLAQTRVSSDSPESDPASDFHNGWAATYKTYCVRLCDGYYWPVSFSTTSERLDRDAETCQSACGSPTRLFVHRIPGGGPGTMVSLDGLPYTALKTAFQFRTKYDAQCKCQPQPWEEASRDRHSLFAAIADARKGSQTAADEIKRLTAKVEAERLDAEIAKKAADLQAAKQLAQLSGKAGELRPFRRSSDQLAGRAGDPSVMRLGLPPDPPARGRFIPASGSGRAWTERVFSGN